MKHLIIAGLFFATCFSCKQEINKGHKLEGMSPEIDSLKSFSVIEKDSAYVVTYKSSKQNLLNGIIVFSYSNGKEVFAFLYDTANRVYKGVFNRVDTITLDLEVEKFYSVNGKDFKLQKLIGNKNVTDGGMCFFFSPEFGLLISQSNTWRFGKILNPEKNSVDYVQITALLYKILTDESMFAPPLPKIKKFTSPKFE